MSLYRHLPRILRDDRREIGFYSQIFSKGDLVFDVGANVGIKTKHFVGVGARVVCLEPLSEAFDQLEFVFRGDRRVTMIPEAIGSSRGKISLYPCITQPGLSSASREWINRGPYSAESRWGPPREIAVATLDHLIAVFGEPRYIKLDIEGWESEALKGLTIPVETVSFEFHGELRKELIECVAIISRLAKYGFNAVLGDSYSFEFGDWLDSANLLEKLPVNPRIHGEIYCRLRS